LEFQWSSDPYDAGMIAMDQSMVDSISTITLTGATGAVGSGSVLTTAGSNGTSWSTVSGSSITLTDPYTEHEERLAKLEKIIAEEEEVRRNHPAVQNAYDEYRLLLVLARKNAGDLLTDE
jgi:hypothetical protein